jgi:hypothetical protein
MIGKQKQPPRFLLPKRRNFRDKAQFKGNPTNYADLDPADAVI